MKQFLRLLMEGDTEAAGMALDRTPGLLEMRLAGSDFTPLCWMLDWSYRRPVLRWLLDRGAEVEAGCGPFQERALHVACRRRRRDALIVLLERGAGIDARTRGGRTAYVHALCRSFHEVVKLLRGRGCDTSLTPADEVAAALTAGDLDKAHGLVRADANLVPSMGPEVARILADLSGSSRCDAMALLLDAGADIAAPGLDGGSALNQAAWFGQPASARMLLDRGAPVNITGDLHDSTPLGWCAHGSRYSGDVEPRTADYVAIARMLLEAGATLAHPSDPKGDPHGRWLLADASDPVAEVLRSHGARNE